MKNKEHKGSLKVNGISFMVASVGKMSFDQFKKDMAKSGMGDKAMRAAYDEVKAKFDASPEGKAWAEEQADQTATAKAREKEKEKQQ